MIDLILLLVALICFILAAAGWDGRLGWLGLAFLTLAALIGAHPVTL